MVYRADPLPVELPRPSDTITAALEMKFFNKTTLSDWYLDILN